MGSKRSWPWLAMLVTVGGLGCVEKTGPVLSASPTPPLPDGLLPVPSPTQLAWQKQEMAAFVHFGMNTFTNTEYGSGTDSPTLFNPTSLDAKQWITSFQNAGFREAILTAKHLDGFCLWPTKCTNYSVAASPFRGGQGDVVREFVNAAREGNLRVGLALYPLDNHDPTYGTSAYAAVFECELTELLTNYGSIDEIYLWLAPSAPNLDWNAIHDLVRQLQPHALLELQVGTPTTANDVRTIAWWGGYVPTDQSSVQTPSVASGTPMWIPAEAIYSIRPDSFWHAADDSQVKTLDQILGLYFDSVGRNSLLRLQVPPNTEGLLADPDVAVLGQLAPAIADLYRINVAAGQPATADSVFRGLAAYDAASAFDGNADTFWAAADGTTTGRLQIDLGGPRSFNLINIQEPIALGERATGYHVEVRINGTWTTLVSGTSIGERKLFSIKPVTADSAALVITAARGAPAISEFGLYDTGTADAAATDAAPAP